MDISPLFVLRQRLHAAALAGAASCPGDARLAQACEALAPLEAAAPVFRKLGDLVRRLRGPEGEGRAAVLLEALTLADALACTQAAVAVPGEAEPVVPAGQGGAMADVPYSVLASFRKDLLSSRKSSPERLWAFPELRPEFFHEYRLSGFLRQGLAAQGGYAKDIVEWLAARGEDILPLLEDGFDPDGGKEMAWRVKVLERARSAAANDFYCAQLDRGGSAAVRREQIYALQHDKSNTARLLELPSAAIVALQLVGGGAGSMIRISGVVAACATVGLSGKEGKLILLCCIPTLILVLLALGAAWILYL